MGPCQKDERSTYCHRRRARDQCRPFNNETGSSLSAIMRCIKLRIRQMLYASEVYTLIQIDFQHIWQIHMIAILFIDT